MIKTLRIITVVLLVITYQINAQGFLKTNEQKIVNDVSDNFLIKGIGLGGWLVQEGYMLQTSDFANAEFEIKDRISELLTEEQFNEYYKAYYENFITKKDIDQIAEWGFNSIRLPMHYDKLTPRDKPGEYIEEGFQLIDKLLGWCEENQIYLILDLHAAPGGQSDEPISDYDFLYPSLWESELNKTRTVDLWRTIAERYADEEWIGGYDLINEPKWELGDKNEYLRDLYIKITEAVREVDTNHIVFIEGNWFATDFNGLTPAWDNNMVYSFHKYWNSNDVGAINYLLTLREQQNVPLWLGESGENSNSWFTDCISLLEDNNIGWAWWTIKKISSTSGMMSVYQSEKYTTLLEYWKGNRTKPTNSYSYTALMEQAEYFKFENCTKNNGVIDAMFRQINSDETVPFKEHTIPGKIFLTEYDYGRRGAAYADSEYENIDDSQWNNGWTFRNDGVDIEECSDNITNGYNVGWISSTEWMKYTVNIPEAGEYNVDIRIAGTTTNGKARVKLDYLSITSYVDIPNTGGWQNWQDVNLGQVELPAGEHNIIIQFYGDNFNANYLEFSLITTDVNDSELNKVKSYLYESYPNPFNNQTNIIYSIAQAGNVEVNIYNLIGEKIDTLVKETQNSGNYKLTWNGDDYNSGIYFLQLETSFGYNKTQKIVLLK